MPSLMDMLAKQNAVNAEPTTGNATAPTPEPAEQAKPIAPLRLGGLRLGAAMPSAAAQTPTPTNESPPSDPTSPAPKMPTLADLEGLSENKLMNESDLVDKTESLDLADFEIPVRELPAEMTAEMKSFVSSLDSIFKLYDDPEMFVDVVRKTQREMQENPALGALLCDADIRVAIRGMRQSAGLAQIKKQATTAKKTTAKKVSSAAVSSAMDSLLALAGAELFEGE